MTYFNKAQVESALVELETITKDKKRLMNQMAGVLLLKFVTHQPSLKMVGLLQQNQNMD